MTSSPRGSRPRSTVHTVRVDAPARLCYDVVADAARWPHTFGPTVHARVDWTDGRAERLRLWAFANGKVRTWTSRREFDPDAYSVRFAQEVSADPVLSMSGEWRITPESPTACRVDLLHEFRTVTEDAVEFVHRAVDTNSGAELAALRRAAELATAHDGLVLSFTDSVSVDAPPGLVYDFLYRADRWPERLPHVSALDLTEDVEGLQSMRMDTRGQDGSVHTTHSVRVCFPAEGIAYKQTTCPPIMLAHTGRWTVREVASGRTEATSAHTVVIDPDQVPEVLGPDGTVARARELIRSALGTNSRTTLHHAKAAAERQATGQELTVRT